jgi:hypothetical protein
LAHLLGLSDGNDELDVIFSRDQARFHLLWDHPTRQRQHRRGCFLYDYEGFYEAYLPPLVTSGW